MKRTILLSGILITLFTVLPTTVSSRSVAYSSAYDFIKSPSTYTLSFGRRLAKRAQVNEECRLVHEHEDKCAFVKQNCGDEEIGVFDYVDLYYCKLPNAPFASFVILGSWLALLFTTLGIAASEFFCVNLSTIATILGMSESITGVTFLALGNGSPDVFSTFAAMKIDAASLAIGELVGAACFISAVVAGAMALVAPDFRVARRSFVRDVSFFIIAVIMIMVFLADGKIRFWECIVMVVFYISYVIFVVGWHWFAGIQKRKRSTLRAAQNHYVALEEEADDESDEDDDGGVGRTRGGRNNDMFSHDFAQLENGEDDDEASDDAHNQQAYAELSSNMRILRPRTERSHTARSIRPSLVGALEFRSLLNSLQRNKSLQGGQIRLEDVSDENLLSARQHSSAPGTRLNSPNIGAVQGSGGGRPRAVSDIIHIDRPVLLAPPNSKNDDLLLPLPGPQNASASALRLDLPRIETDTGNFDAFQGKSAPLSPLVLPERLEASEANDSPLLLDSPVGPPSKSSSGSTVRNQRSPNGLEALRHIRRGSIANSDFLQPLPSPKWNEWSFWPYDYLPPPQEFFSALFPTLSDFKEKTLLDKLSSIVVVPSVFLLTVTLPVVDIPTEKNEETGIPILQVDSPGSSIHEGIEGVPSALSAGPPEPEDSRHVQWNRWLVLTQCVLAPIFVVLTAFGGEGNILFPILYGILAGFVGIGIILYYTNPDKPPKLRYLLCFVGFIVSISWISTIANEVVGVLKAFGVILGISDAILGLTVFAVGNSLSDLVANITVARLGYPVMALSACFGGPMLNILLGIGLSGLYMTVTKNEPYKIDVSPTLVISAVTLLITLSLLIVFVPLNQWKMTKRIGFMIIGVWMTSTIANLVVEMVGLSHKKLT